MEQNFTINCIRKIPAKFSCIPKKSTTEWYLYKDHFKAQYLEWYFQLKSSSNLAEVGKSKIDRFTSEWSSEEEICLEFLTSKKQGKGLSREVN